LPPRVSRLSCSSGSCRTGRKSVKPWGDGRFFLDLPQSLCRRADADTGDSVEIVLVPVSDDPPDELVAAVTADPSARRSWERLSPSQRRAIVNDVLDAVRADTRQRRVERWARHLGRRS
jgi:Bacteriocin-protection, YdeI or OmpD-Associated